MFNRRRFLKAGAAMPAAAALGALDGRSALSAAMAVGVITGGPEPTLIALPARLAPVDPASEPWQKKIRRVGQSNMT